MASVLLCKVHVIGELLNHHTMPSLTSFICIAAPVACAAWSPCGTAIVSGDEQARLLIWRALPRYSYMAAPGPALFYFRIQLMHGAFQHDLANATATAHPTVLTGKTQVYIRS